MRHILLLIFVTKSFASFESSNDDGKYIDLLPDEEKREFLDRVGRRILAQIKSKETPIPDKKSVEIPDDQLDKHNAFVNKILEEESKYLRTQKKNIEKRDIKEENVTQDMFKNILTVTSQDKDKEDRIDLTLRQGVRQKRNTSTDTEVGKGNTEINHTVIPVKNIYGVKSNDTVVKNSNSLIPKNNDAAYKSDMDIQVRGLNRRYRSNKETKVPVIVMEPNVEKSDINLNEERSDLKIEQSIDSITISNIDEDYTSRDNPSTISTFNQNMYWSPNNHHENRSEFTEKSIVDVSTGISVINTSVNNFEISTSTTDLDKNGMKVNNTHLIIHEYLIRNKTSETLNSQAATTKKYLYTTENNDSMTVIPLDKPSINVKNDLKLSNEEIRPYITTMFLDAVTSKSNIQNIDGILKQLDNATYENGKQTELKEVTNTTDIIPVTKFQLPSKNSASIHLKKPLKSTMKQEFIKNSTIDLKVNSKNPVDNMNLTIATNIKHALRHRVDIDETENEEVQKLSYGIKSSREQTVNTYQVYEIRPGQVPFVNREELDKPEREDRQYYAPVHNHSPNNAYYYPHNEFGPNYGIEPDEGGQIANIHRNNKYETTYNKQINLEDNRKFRFETTNQKYEDTNSYQKINNHNRNLYQLVLPPAPIKPKRTKIFYDNYLDEDYYNNKGSRENSNNGIPNKFDNSDEYEYAFSIDNFRNVSKKVFNSNGESYSYNTNLKNHLRSLRTNLKLNNPDQIVLLKKDGEVKNSKTDDIYVARMPQTLEQRSDRDPMYDDTDSISADYYFGRKNIKSHMTLPSIQRSNLDKPYNKNSWLRVLNVKNENDYMVDEQLATPNPTKNYELVKKILPALQTNKFKNKIKYSSNIGKFTDNDFMLKSLDKLLGPSKADDEVAAFVEAMQNLLRDRSEALQQYDWLGTTVNIQSAIEKLIDMTVNLLNGKALHPADLELLEYVTFLHIVAKHEMGRHREINRRYIPVKKHSNTILPRNKRKPKYNIVKTKGIIDRIWLYRANVNVTAKYDLRHFKQFLDNLQNCLYDLHTALKYISMITSFSNQRWFENLEDLYLNGANTKQYLELILHVSAVRLIDLLEDSSKNGVEDNFMVYIKKNREIVRRSVEEFIFVKRIVEEITKL